MRLRLQRFALLSHFACMVTGADKGSTGNFLKADGFGDVRQFVEFLGWNVALHWKITQAGLQILPERQEIATEFP